MVIEGCRLGCMSTCANDYHNICVTCYFSHSFCSFSSLHKLLNILFIWFPRGSPVNRKVIQSSEFGKCPFKEVETRTSDDRGILGSKIELRPGGGLHTIRFRPVRGAGCSLHLHQCSFDLSRFRTMSRWVCSSPTATNRVASPSLVMVVMAPETGPVVSTSRAKDPNRPRDTSS